MNKTILTREELYRRVWSTPMSKLSQELGLSDVGLAKVCKRFNIPRPPRGHWAKLEHGQKVTQPPLPKVPESAASPIEIRPGPLFRRHSGTHVDLSAESSLANIEERILVPEKLSSPHPLIEEARIQLRTAVPDHHGLVHTNRETAPAISIAVSSKGRALRIFNTLICAWEAKGGRVKPGRPRHEHVQEIRFWLGDDSLGLRLWETTQPLNDPEILRNTIAYRHRKHRPTGELYFEADRNWRVRLRCVWSDGKKQRLEDLMNRIINDLVAHLRVLRVERLDGEAVERQKARAKAIRDTAEREKKDEEDRRVSLSDQVVRWRHAQDIRAYLAAMDHAIRTGVTKPINEDSFGKWFGWAKWYANHIDPLIQAPIPTEDNGVSPNPTLDKLDLTSLTKAVLKSMDVHCADDLTRVTYEEIKARVEASYSVWEEICRVLEGLGYRPAGRQ